MDSRLNSLTTVIELTSVPKATLINVIALLFSLRTLIRFVFEIETWKFIPDINSNKPEKLKTETSHRINI